MHYPQKAENRFTPEPQNRPERKVIISSAVFCMAVMLASVITAAVFATSHREGWVPVPVATFYAAWWLGSSMAAVLKNNPE